MKKINLCISLLMLVSSSLYAAPSNKETCPLKKACLPKKETCLPKKETCLPKKEVKTQTIYKSVPDTKHVYTNDEKTQATADAKQESDLRNTSEQNAKTGNQTVTVNVPPPKVLIRTVNKRFYKKVIVSNPNRLQLLVGESQTKLSTEYDGCCNLRAKREKEFDVGVQYLRDLGSFTGSLMVTHRQSAYLGIGFNW